MAEDGHHCLFMEEKAINAWEMQAPMLIILVFNTFFLVWVISVCWNYYNIQTNSLPIQLKLLLWLNFHRCRNGRKICDHKFRKQIDQNLSIPVANSCQHRPSAKLITTFPCHRCCFNSTSNMNKIKKVVKSELLEKEELILNLFF